MPISRELAISLAKPPESVERSLWLYELCRFLTMKVNNLIIAFFAEDPPCSAQTCPEMRASEWQYLCAVHDPPKSCCAIDYCCHTVDWATNILTSPKYFPSRLTLGSEAGGGPQASMRNLTNIFRRLYRIFAHAWFQHRSVFWQVEGHDGLYVFFKTVCDIYNLIPDDNYTIPAEAEGPVGHDSESVNTPATDEVRHFSILRKDGDGSPNSQITDTDAASSVISTGATTRRHKHSPSTGSSVATIAEGLEEVEDPQDSNENTQLHINVTEPVSSTPEDIQTQLNHDPQTLSTAKEELQAIPSFTEPTPRPTSEFSPEKKQQEIQHTTSETTSETATTATAEHSSSAPPPSIGPTASSTDPIAETTAALAALRTDDSYNMEPRVDIPSGETNDSPSSADGTKYEEQPSEDKLLSPTIAIPPNVTVKPVNDEN